MNLRDFINKGCGCSQKRTFSTVNSPYSYTSLDSLETSSQIPTDHGFKTLICKNCGNSRQVSMCCGDRLCPTCSVKRAYRLRIGYRRAISGMRRPKLLTLTLPTSPQLSKETVGFIRSSFSRLRRRKPFVRHRKGDVINRCVGGIYVIEIKKSSGRWNVHIHALIDMDVIPQKDISDAWYQITKSSFIVDIRRAWGARKGLNYLLKYISKPPRFRSEADRDIYRESMKGVRLIQDFGRFYNSIRRHVCICKECGCSEWIILEYMDELVYQGYRPGFPP